MSLIDEKAWNQYQTAIERQQRLRIVSSAFVILSTAMVFAIIALNDYYYPGPLELIGLYLLLFLILFSGILGISYVRHYFIQSAVRWRIVYLQRLRIVTLAFVALCVAIISFNVVIEDLFGWFLVFLVVLLVLVSSILGISYFKHNWTPPRRHWRSVFIPKRIAGVKEKEKILQIIKTSSPASLLDIGRLMRVAGVTDRELIVELVQDAILLGTIDYEHNKLLPGSSNVVGFHPQGSGALDITSLRQIIQEQAYRITQLEESVRTLESALSLTSSQESYECSICRKEIKEGEPVWADSEQHVFHPPHIKEWIRVNATHPITKAKMPQKLEHYNPNVVLINGTLINLEQAQIQGLF
jgi:hypothetical protein